jgi:uncharacterized protein YtpQ (UPF0354 family)
VLVRRPKPDDAALIVPLVKQAIPENDPASVFELTPDDTPIAESLLPGLCLLFAFDRPDSYEIVLERNVRELGISVSELRNLAIRNLRRRLPAIERHGDHPAYMLTAGGNLESSLLLLPDLWEQQASWVPGELVAAVPERDVILFTGADSPEGLEAICSSIQRLWSSAESHHLLTRELFAWRNHAWAPFEAAAA